MFFKCKHPHASLVVDKEQTIESAGADFDHVTYHLFCQKCFKPVKIVHAKTKHGVDAFLSKSN